MAIVLSCQFKMGIISIYVSGNYLFWGVQILMDPGGGIFRGFKFVKTEPPQNTASFIRSQLVYTPGDTIQICDGNE